VTDDSTLAPGSARNAAAIDLAIQFGCLSLLAYWAFVLVQPFLTIIVWSVVLAVVLYPIFDWMVGRLGIPAFVAVLLITVFNLAVLLGPTTWLGLSLIDTVRSLADRLGSGDIAVPKPPERIKDWPFIGANAYELWLLASTNLRAAFQQILPDLAPLRSTLLDFAGGAGMGMFKFVVAVLISGFLLLPGPTLVDVARSASRRIAVRRGNEFIDLIGATIRNLARGVIGVSVLQSLLAGIGLMVAQVPGAGAFGFLVLLLGIIQIDAGVVLVPIILWSWTKMDTTPALIFSVYMVAVTLLNNFLRPFVMAHGLKTPVLVIFIGVLGGLLTHGVVGLFLGPIVLAIGWELVKTWALQPGGRGDERAPLSGGG